jgi:alpha,alpha-trehalase
VRHHGSFSCIGGAVHRNREKYNVVSDSSNTKFAEGYRDNIVGFGWTNGVFLELLHTLPEEYLKRLIAQPVPTAQP